MQNGAYMAVLFSLDGPPQSIRRATTMYALKVLHKKLASSCPFIHKKRLAILILATHALIVGQRLSLTQLGRRLFSKAFPKHNIKRIDRLLSNTHLHQERSAVYQFLCHELLNGHAQPLIVVDWSDLTSERDYHFLRASIPVGGRALTIYEEVHPQKNIGKNNVHKRFLRKLRDLLPPGCCPIIITDAGFRNPWFKAVRRLGWDYVGRVRNRYMLTPIHSDDWQPCKTLYAEATHRPCYLGEYQVVRSNPIDTYLYLVTQKSKGRHRYNDDGTRTKRGQSEKMAKRQQEPWLITTSLVGEQKHAQRIIKLYKTRMQIEEAFRDTKSTRIGFSLSESLTRNLQRLEILLLIGALATFQTWLLGVLAELKQWHRQYQSNSNKKRRVLSIFFIGCQIAKENKLVLKSREYKTALSQIKANALEQCHV
jgi:hypothetical protein